MGQPTAKYDICVKIATKQDGKGVYKQIGERTEWDNGGCSYRFWHMHPDAKISEFRQGDRSQQRDPGSDDGGSW